MNKILLLLAIIAISCSSQKDCDAEKAKITQSYSAQIKAAGDDQRKIDLLRSEMARKLATACD